MRALILSILGIGLAVLAVVELPRTAVASGPVEPLSFENLAGMKMVKIPAGQFIMGSPQNEDGRDPEEVQHLVTITRRFFMSANLVTQAQWVVVMNNDPSRWLGDELPVEQVSWNDAMEFCRRLSQIERKHYRLPTEAEWEYACRAGTTGQFNTGDGEAAMAFAGFYADNSDGRTHSVGRKQPNAWGLLDMHGDLWEWCSDYYSDYPAGPLVDPTGPATGNRRVCRGGSWTTSALECRSAARNDRKQDLRDSTSGFRVVLDVN